MLNFSDRTRTGISILTSAADSTTELDTLCCQNSKGICVILPPAACWHRVPGPWHSLGPSPVPGRSFFAPPHTGTGPNSPGQTPAGHQGSLPLQQHHQQQSLATSLDETNMFY